MTPSRSSTLWHFRVSSAYYGYLCKRSIGYVDIGIGERYILKILDSKTQIISEILSEPVIRDFVWSPDGKKIFCVCGKESGSGEIPPTPAYIASLHCDDSTSQCSLTEKKEISNIGLNPSWSYDSTLIISAPGKEGGGGLIRFIDTQGNIVREIDLSSLAPDLDFIQMPVQSPNGKWIAFSGGNLNTHINNIYILDLQTMTLENLTGHIEERKSYGTLVW